MNCVICKTGTTNKGKASFTAERGGSFVVFSNVDAEVCDNCGEAYFNAATIRALESKAEQELSKGKAIELVKL